MYLEKGSLDDKNRIFYFTSLCNIQNIPLLETEHNDYLETGYFKALYRTKIFQKPV